MSLTCPTCRRTYPDGTVHCPVDTSALLPDEAFANADVPIETGTMIGEYRIEKKLGEGTFGAVYAGLQPVIGKKVAVKLLHKRMSSEPEIVARFIDEARAVNKIQHRNIIDVFSFGVYNGTQHYFVMEFCEGMTLGQLLQLKKRLTPMEALPILRGIADGLDAAHQAGVTHRDLKPDNVFLVRIKDNQYFPKLLDFGVAKLAKEEGAQRTATGVTIGTPRYMSPEQGRGKKVDHRSDVYSLGCVAYEMLTGRPVFEADSTIDLLFKHMTENPLPPSIACPQVPPELDEPILEMLSKRPLGRPNSAGGAINAFADAIRLAARMSKPPPTPPFGTPAVVLMTPPATAVAADTVRAPEPASDVPPTLPNDPTRTATMDPARPMPLVETIHAVINVPSPSSDPIPATRKSLTEWDIAQMTAKPPDSENTEVASNPPIQSQVPATLASAPLTTVGVIDHVPEVKVVGARELGKPATKSLALGPMADPTKRNLLFAVGGVALLVGVGVVLARRTTETLPTTTPETAVSQIPSQMVKPEPTTITLRATVTPADAHIFVDGKDMGRAGDAIVLPREQKQRAIRIERKGYDPQTMWVPVDADKQIGPITLVLHIAAPIASTSASGKKPAAAASAGSAKAATTATNKSKVNKELLRPKEFGGTK